MRIRDSIGLLEQQIYVACCEGDYEMVNMLEQELEVLRDRVEHPDDDNMDDIHIHLDWEKS